MGLGFGSQPSSVEVWAEMSTLNWEVVGLDGVNHYYCCEGGGVYMDDHLMCDDGMCGTFCHMLGLYQCQHTAAMQLFKGECLALRGVLNCAVKNREWDIVSWFLCLNVGI